MPKKRGEASHMWKGGRRVDKDGYVWVYSPMHPKAHWCAYLEHRLVMEASIGRYLERYEHVHHKNGDRADNRLDNLELLTATDHAKEHKLGTNRRGISVPLDVRRKIADAHLGKPKASRGKKKSGRNLEASRANIARATAVKLARKAERQFAEQSKTK